MADARTERTIASIKEALLTLLNSKPFDDISMAEIAREANISRSTLYMHFANPLIVFDLLVADFHKSIRGLGLQLRCDRCGGDRRENGTPYCEALRNAGKYTALVCDPNYAPRMIAIYSQGVSAEKMLQPYTDAGLDKNVAAHMFAFQMLGCYSAATSVKGAQEWERTQKAIDAFIKGGLQGIRAAFAR